MFLLLLLLLLLPLPLPPPLPLILLPPFQSEPRLTEHKSLSQRSVFIQSKKLNLGQSMSAGSRILHLGSLYPLETDESTGGFIATRFHMAPDQGIGADWQRCQRQFDSCLTCAVVMPQTQQVDPFPSWPFQPFPSAFNTVGIKHQRYSTLLLLFAIGIRWTKSNWQRWRMLWPTFNARATGGPTRWPSASSRASWTIFKWKGQCQWLFRAHRPLGRCLVAPPLNRWRWHPHNSPFLPPPVHLSIHSHCQIKSNEINY